MNVAHASARRGEHQLRPLVGDRAVVAATKTAVLQLWWTVSAAWAQAVAVAEINERMLIAEASSASPAGMRSSRRIRFRPRSTPRTLYFQPIICGNIGK